MRKPAFGVPRMDAQACENPLTTMRSTALISIHSDFSHLRVISVGICIRMYVFFFSGTLWFSEACNMSNITLTNVEILDLYFLRRIILQQTSLHVLN